MQSPEFIQALGRDRHQDLLAEAATARLAHSDDPEGFLARARARLERAAARRRQIWVSGPMAGKPAHG